MGQVNERDVPTKRLRLWRKMDLLGKEKSGHHNRAVHEKGNEPALSTGISGN